MVIRLGEIRRVGVVVSSITNQAFVIGVSEFALRNKSSSEIIAHGDATIEGHVVYTLITGDTVGVGEYECDITYRIASEVLKITVPVSVIE